jgi:class 3 adenylate cyclase
VGSLAILFTDLRDSTVLYREIGDAPAFGRVLDHFTVLRETIAAEQGALVKTIGDAVMAVFLRPVSAVRAMLAAQTRLAAWGNDGGPRLHLKAGVHYGPCIAVTLNDRLDYFGSTVNLASRLEKFSSGDDIIVSGVVRQDPEVAELIELPEGGLEAERFQAQLKGFAEQEFPLWRLARDGRGSRRPEIKDPIQPVVRSSRVNEGT